jgi:hypothetical protein
LVGWLGASDWCGRAEAEGFMVQGARAMAGDARVARVVFAWGA